MNSFQLAYSQHHSAETALLRITDSLCKICATGNASFLVLLDLFAAFDTLDHNMLIDVLSRHFNISDLTLFLICSYLSQRSQFACCRTVLGPICFSLCTSLFCSNIEMHDLLFYQFADDITLFTKVSFPIPNLTLCKLSTCLSALSFWLPHSQLKLYPTRCSSIA